MTGRETAGREGKGQDGRARTREVKLGVFFTHYLDRVVIRRRCGAAWPAVAPGLPAFA